MGGVCSCLGHFQGACMKEGYGFKIGDVVENHRNVRYYKYSVGKIISIKKFRSPMVYNNLGIKLPDGSTTFWSYLHITKLSSLMQELF
jgi:hypothetical protein